MADKFLQVGATGLPTEQEFITTSTGAADGGKGIATDPVTGTIHESLFPAGIGAEVTIAPASEALSAGDLVSFWNDSGTLRVRKADASSANAGRVADGFVKAAVLSGASASVYTDSGTINAYVSGLTVGTVYYLSAATPGGLTNTPPTTAGHCVQPIGKALSATSIRFAPGTPIIRA